MKYLPVLFVTALVLSLPELSFAQGFVPCSGTDCSACHFVAMTNTIIKWLIGAFFLLFAVLAVMAGFELVTSGGNDQAKTSAKSKFSNAFIGLIIVLAAFILVDTLMRSLLTNPDDIYTGYGPWSEIKCGTQSGSDSALSLWAGDPSGTRANANVVSTTACSPAAGGGNTDCAAAIAACTALGLEPDVDSTSDPANHQVNCWNLGSATPPAPLPGTPVAGCSGSSCVPLGAVPCSNPASCSISADLQPKLLAMHNAAGVAGARVTEAMPPTRVHKSACHQNGTCVDYSVSGGMAPADVVKVINAATANGLRPVYEVKTQAQKDAVVAAGAPADSVKVLGSWISAPHFSIYGS